MVSSLKKFQFKGCLSLTFVDFLLAAMILSLDILSIDQCHQVSLSNFPPEAEKHDAIKRSRSIWTEVLDHCKDARRAVNLLDKILRKVSLQVEQRKASFENSMKPPLSASVTNPNADTLRYSPYFTDQFGLGIPLIGILNSGVDTLMQDGLLTSGGIIDALGSDLNLPANFDWVSRSTYCSSVWC